MSTILQRETVAYCSSWITSLSERRDLTWDLYVTPEGSRECGYCENGGLLGSNPTGATCQVCHLKQGAPAFQGQASSSQDASNHLPARVQEHQRRCVPSPGNSLDPWLRLLSDGSHTPSPTVPGWPGPAGMTVPHPSGDMAYSIPVSQILPLISSFFQEVLVQWWLAWTMSELLYHSF